MHGCYARWSIAVCLAAGLLASTPAWTPVAGEDLIAGEAPLPADEAVLEEDGLGGAMTFRLSDWLLQPPPLPPVVPPSGEGGLAAPPAAAEFAPSVFAPEDVPQSLIGQYRRRAVRGVGTELVFGSEGNFRVTTDTGDLLGKSLNAPSVRIQQRMPNVSDPRIRGMKGGRLIASGSYWAPAREDLDTPLSKIDSRTIQDVIVYKGPYTSMLGPGFYFVDFEFVPTPRSADGYQFYGSTALEYHSNGEQFYGRQMVAGGAENYGYRVSYGHRTGSDYTTGDGWEIPSSYKSRYLDAALGYDFAPDSHLEFNYLRVDQTDVEFPGMVFDINAAGTNGYELRYCLEEQPGFDLLTVEGWYNRTAFSGDTRRSGKNRQIPSLRPAFGLGPDQFLTTDVDGMSAGYRAAVTWGQLDESSLTLGTDLIRLGQQLNDIVPEHEELFFLPPPLPPLVSTIPERNYPIPRSSSLDVGFFAEHQRAWNDLLLRGGARVDLVTTRARNEVPGLGILGPGFPDPILIETGLAELKQVDSLDREFAPWSVFGTAEYELLPCWIATAGAGYAMRPPSLTELYAAGPFIGSLQPGLTFVEGDPLLDPERLVQLDLGLRADLGSTRFSAAGFYAWIFDYVTYDDIGEAYHPQPLRPAFDPGEDLQHVAFVNTDLATLAGFELLAEQDLTRRLTGFAVMSYIEGRDRARNSPSRVAAIIRERALLDPETPRSFEGQLEHEPLPGIPPLETRLGLRLKDPCCQRWAVELEARIVDDQDRVARTLFESPTPGFTIWNLRGYWQPAERLTLYGGVENIGDKMYREHLDYRAGRGVWQPGTSFYALAELLY